jgi:ribonuclease HI
MRLIIRTDGGSRGNPGPAGAGIVIRDEKRNLIFGGGFYLGEMTNNLAEYHALLIALQLAIKIDGTHIQVFSDSELLVRQVNGQYKVKNEHLRSLHQQVQELKGQFAQFMIAHVYREENAEADSFVNRALSAKSNVGGFPGQSGDEPSGPSVDVQENSQSAGDGPAVLDLRKKIAFNTHRVHRQSLGRQPELASELICLNPHQRYTIESDGVAGSAVLLEGGGAIVTGRQQLPLEKNAWLEWPPSRKFEFISGDETMVLLITRPRL